MEEDEDTEEAEIKKGTKNSKEEIKTIVKVKEKKYIGNKKRDEIKENVIEKNVKKEKEYEEKKEKKEEKEIESEREEKIIKKEDNMEREQENKKDELTIFNEENNQNYDHETGNKFFLLQDFNLKEKNENCDACNYCDDVCFSEFCKSCKIKKSNLYRKYKNSKNINFKICENKMKKIFLLNKKIHESLIFTNQKSDKRGNNENIKNHIEKINNEKKLYTADKNNHRLISSSGEKNSICKDNNNNDDNNIDNNDNDGNGKKDYYDTLHDIINKSKISMNSEEDNEKKYEFKYNKYKQHFTKCEIKRHNKISDCWLIVNGYVYDVTAIINHHPGGINCILKKGGEDATVDYSFHSKYAQKNFWEPLKIGKVVKCKKDVLEEKKKKNLNLSKKKKNICSFM